ncbi:uncharacterized protein AB9W97_021280 [Spinachia spinachia]
MLPDTKHSIRSSLFSFDAKLTTTVYILVRKFNRTHTHAKAMAENNYQQNCPVDATMTTCSRDEIFQLTKKVMELKMVNSQSELMHFQIQEATQRIIDLEKVEADQKCQITKLCEEKEAWQEERKRFEEICLRSKKKTQGVDGNGKADEFELAELKRKVVLFTEGEKAFQSKLDFWKDHVDTRMMQDSSSSPSPSCPPSPASLQKKEMNTAQRTIKSLRHQIAILNKSLEDFKNKSRDNEAGLTKAQQTVETQKLEISSLKQCLSALKEKGKDYEAEMIQARQTIERQGLEISSLKERLQDGQMVATNQAEEIQEYSKEKLLLSREANFLKSTNVDLEKSLLDSTSLLTNTTNELHQSLKNCLKENTTLRIENETLKGESKILERALCAERMKSEQLEDDQQLLEDICLRMKKRTLGFFGRRMEDRATEMAKMRRKIVENDTKNGYIRRTRHDRTERVEEAAQSIAVPLATAGLAV